MTKSISWDEAHSYESKDDVSLSGVVAKVASGEFKEEHKEVQILTIDEPPHKTEGNAPRQLILIVPIERQEYKVGERLRFKGDLHTQKDGKIIVKADSSEIKEWSGSEEVNDPT
jgi:hypothetical protein